MGQKARAKRVASRRRALVDRILRLFITEMRAIVKRVAPGYYKRFPKAGRPCHTCAFNPSTDRWKGFDTTVSGLLKCVYQDRPFYCHEGIPWRKPVDQWSTEDHRQFEANKQLCSGFAILLCPDANEDAKRALLKIAREQRPALQDAVRSGFEL